MTAAGVCYAGQRRIPLEEMGVATDLYLGLQSFYDMHAYLAHRPLIIAGESYAGKYVPSIGTAQPSALTALLAKAYSCIIRMEAAAATTASPSQPAVASAAGKPSEFQLAPSMNI